MYIHILYSSTPPPPSMAGQLPVDQGFLNIDSSRSHSDTPHSVGLLWTSDQPDSENSTCQHPTHKRVTSMTLTGFEPTIPTSQRPQTDALDRAATGTGTYINYTIHATAACLDIFSLSPLNNHLKIGRRFVGLLYKQHDRGAHMQGARSSGPLNFVLSRLIFVSPQYGTCCMSLFWRPEFWGRSYTFGISVLRLTGYSL